MSVPASPTTRRLTERALNEMKNVLTANSVREWHEPLVKAGLLGVCQAVDFNDELDKSDASAIPEAALKSVLEHILAHTPTAEVPGGSEANRVAQLRRVYRGFLSAVEGSRLAASKLATELSGGTGGGGRRGRRRASSESDGDGSDSDDGERAVRKQQRKEKARRHVEERDTTRMHEIFEALNDFVGMDVRRIPAKAMRKAFTEAFESSKPGLPTLSDLTVAYETGNVVADGETLARAFMCVRCVLDGARLALCVELTDRAYQRVTPRACDQVSLTDKHGHDISKVGIRPASLDRFEHLFMQMCLEQDVSGDVALAAFSEAWSTLSQYMKENSCTLTYAIGEAMIKPRTVFLFGGARTPRVTISTAAAQREAPDVPSRKPCRDWAKGTCRRANCSFAHDGPAGGQGRERERSQSRDRARSPSRERSPARKEDAGRTPFRRDAPKSALKKGRPFA